MNELDLRRETETMASVSWRHQDPRSAFKLKQDPRQQLEGTKSRIWFGIQPKCEACVHLRKNDSSMTSRLGTTVKPGLRPAKKSA